MLGERQFGEVDTNSGEVQKGQATERDAFGASYSSEQQTYVDGLRTRVKQQQEELAKLNRFGATPADLDELRKIGVTRESLLDDDPDPELVQGIQEFLKTKKEILLREQRRLANNLITEIKNQEPGEAPNIDTTNNLEESRPVQKESLVDILKRMTPAQYRNTILAFVASASAGYLAIDIVQTLTGSEDIFSKITEVISGYNGAAHDSKTLLYNAVHKDVMSSFDGSGEKTYLETHGYRGLVNSGEIVRERAKEWYYGITVTGSVVLGALGALGQLFKRASKKP